MLSGFCVGLAENDSQSSKVEPQSLKWSQPLLMLYSVLIIFLCAQAAEEMNSVSILSVKHFAGMLQFHIKQGSRSRQLSLLKILKVVA